MTADSKSPPKVAYLCGMYPAVSLTFILREIEALRAQGVDVVTCSVRRTPPEQHPGPVEKAHAETTFNILETAKKPLKLLGAFAWAVSRPGLFLSMLSLAWKTRGPGLRANLLQIAYAVEAMILAQHLTKEGVGHIHNHFVSASATVAMLAAKLADIPFSYSLHGPTDFIEPLRWHIGEKTANAAFVACISHYCRAQAMFFSDPAHWQRLHIVRCGVSPALYEQPRKNRDGDRVELLFVGRLARVKGLLVLFEAMANIDPKVDLRLTIIGDGPDRDLLEQAAEPLGERIEFVGYRSQTDVADKLTETDMFVLPSFAEGVPVVLMEAMASRVPVIATSVAGVTELVEPGVSGFVVPAGDPEALTSAITELAADPDRRVAMGHSGRDRVTEEFDIERSAAVLAELFARPVPR